jgi:adenylate cyclase
MKAFFAELRKRHVIKVAIAYLVVSWVVLQLADVILPALYLPDWTITLTLGLLAVGFPIALGLSWVFDITSEGILRTEDVRSDTGPVQSIAVLPFSDISAEQDQAHFCDGLTEELLNVLTRIPNLRVASRTSCFACRNNDIELSEVAEKLRVGHILEGSVRKAGNQVRISAQLIEVATDSHLWAETYDREFDDIFAIQDDIAASILEALKLKLGKADLPDPTTTNAKAYEYYLRGRGYAMTNSADDIDRAITMFEKAVLMDPGFLRAWTDLAEVSAIKAIFFGGGEPAQKKADHAGDEAMRLAPDRAGSYMAHAFGQLSCLCYAEAEAAFLKALELDPDQIRAYLYLARAAHHQGQTERSLCYFVAATEKNPEDWESPILALGAFKKTGDQEGGVRSAKIALERLERHLEDYPDNPRAYYLGVSALSTLGEDSRIREWGDRALELAPDDPATHYNMACSFARAGDTERALDLLENSIQSRSWIENDGDLDSLRSHPRYQALIDKMQM